ncbi:MAG: hypothetical protein BAJALOKI2v1_190005 [Promethearchaeota archaeon]|nr:MAG: hypothetical protein BAJALOKI2v1_190005 [Candidatus Lokiarchaeota archaeon]
MPWKRINKKDIKFDPEVQTYCVSEQFNCPNYNHSWACPPEAPYLEEEILQNYRKFYLVYSKMQLNQKITTEQRSGNKSSRNRSKNLSSLQKYNLIRNKIEQEIEKFLNDPPEDFEEVRVLWDGHCRICEEQGKKCTYDEGIACRYPEKIRYSMEAVGIHVTKTVKKVDIDIEWPPRNHIYRFALICLK